MRETVGQTVQTEHENAGLPHTHTHTERKRYKEVENIKIWRNICWRTSRDVGNSHNTIAKYTIYVQLFIWIAYHITYPIRSNTTKFSNCSKQLKHNLPW